MRLGLLLWPHLSKAFSTAVRPPIQKGTTSPARSVPARIARPPYVGRNGTPLDVEYKMDKIITLKTSEMELMRKAGQIAKETMDYVKRIVKIDAKTDEIDQLVHDFIISKDSYPSPLHYSGFPKSICTSVNEVICHGIPDNRKLQDGDIVNVDITIYHKGFHADMSEMFTIGEVDGDAVKLIETTRKCLDEAIKVCGPNKPFNIIGKVISEIATDAGFNIQPNFSGHGIGRYFHSGPYIEHIPNLNLDVMKPGNAFTIEPILVEGSPNFKLWDDGWTAVTIDGSRSAQVEHTILITQGGYEILTA